MPLPPEWRKVVDPESGRERYHTISEDVYLEFNPAEPFVFFLVDRARKYTSVANEVTGSSSGSR